MLAVRRASRSGEQEAAVRRVVRLLHIATRTCAARLLLLRCDGVAKVSSLDGDLQIPTR